MRTLITTLFLLCIQYSNAHAQAVQGQHEVTAGAGAGALYNLLENAFSSGNTRYVSSGIYGASYRYYVRRRVTIGANVAYEQVAGRGSSRVREMFVSICPEITFSYMDRAVMKKRTALRIYCLADLGATVYKDLVYKDVKVFPGFHLSPVGIRVGKDLAGYVELGLGYKGLVNGGISYRIPATKKPIFTN